MTEQAWLQLNQTYLMAHIKVVAAMLRLYQVSNQEEDTEAAEQALQEAEAAVARLQKELSGQPALDKLTIGLGLSSFEQKVLLVCAGIEIDNDFAALVKDLQAESKAVNPSFNFLFAVFADAHWSASMFESPLQYWALLNQQPSSIFTHTGLSIDPNVLHYLFGWRVNSSDKRLRSFTKVITNKTTLVGSHEAVGQQVLSTIIRCRESQTYPIFQLSGPNNKDKASIALYTARELHLDLFEIELSFLQQDRQERDLVARLLNRFAALEHVAFYFDLAKWGHFDADKKRIANRFLSQLKGLVLVGCPSPLQDIASDVISYEVHSPSRTEQQLLWKTQLNLNGTSAAQLQEFTYQFNFEAATLQTLAQEMQLKLPAEEVEDHTLFQQLYQVCYQYTRASLSGLAQRIEALATWDDLVLPKAQRSILHAISLQMKARQQVYYQWGFAGKSNRGLGISALFAGASGTGKTMAAEVLANALGLDLYKVDLSQVINKYIGETEKNLKKIFDAAELSGAILLFDEADALFGKRSEVKDSHDRHANIEVSYLLQRMESYRGLAILTTNMKTALDKAFMRRIRFVVNFPFPDAGLRAEIWQRIFPDQVPTQALDMTKLARLNIAGGNIKNIALNAAFLAADQNQAVTMQHLQEAAQNEYSKLEKQMSPKERLT